MEGPGKGTRLQIGKEVHSEGSKTRPRKCHSTRPIRAWKRVRGRGGGRERVTPLNGTEVTNSENGT